MCEDFVLKIVEDLSKIGRTSDGGSNRLGFSKSDIEAREYILNIIKDLGLTSRIDGFGNIIARYDGGSKEFAAVATGSHIDTVPNGGHYDGILGVAASIAAIKSIKDDGIKLNRPLELIVFQLEESSRFGHATMGSKVMVGRDVLSKFKEAKDKEGNTLIDVLSENGLDFNKLGESKRTADEFHSFVEVHIDQSKDLLDADKPIGVVEAISAPIRYKINIVGEAAHSGATKISDRKDALVAAAELILAVRNLALAYADKNVIATVGDIKVSPGAMNVVPGKAEVSLDLRGSVKAFRDEASQLIEDECMKIATRHSVDIEMNKISDEDPVPMDAVVSSTIINATQKLGIESINVVSGAGHDAMNMTEITRAGMIFVRNTNGMSHTPEEMVDPEDIKLLYRVLKETLIDLATQ